MTDEDKLIHAYRKMDLRGKSAVLSYAVSMSEDWPLDLSGPVGLAAGELNNLEAPPVISASKEIK